MPLPVKVSDRLLALAKAEARSTHRSATAQIEHWATLGRAVEVMMAYREVLALKTLAETLPVSVPVTFADAHDALITLTPESAQEKVKSRIRTSDSPVYTMDPSHPGKILEVRPDGTRIPGHLDGRRFVADPAKRGARRSPLAKR